MKVGIVLPQNASEGDGATWRDIAARAGQAEAGGIDSLWLYDHLVYRPADEPETAPHEAWTLLAGIAAVTNRVELGTIVLATSFRPPAVLAKMAVTADDIADGRLVLGLGCGWYEPEYRAFGFPFDHRVGRFEEALGVIVPLIRGERVTFSGRWTQVEDAIVLPAPRRPRIPIMVAARGERMLRLTARHADAWNTAWFGLPDERYRQRHDALLAACDAAARDSATLEITVGVTVQSDASQPDPRGTNAVPLDVHALVDALGAWSALGVGHVQLGPQIGTEATFEVILEAVRQFRSTDDA